MGIANLLSGLGGMLYELPKKAVSYATLQEHAINPENCADVNAAKLPYMGTVGGMNGDAADPQLKLDTVHRMQEYAINRFGDFESYFQLRNYLEKCNVNPDSLNQLTDKGRHLVDTAYQFYQEHGIEVPFTPYPILDAIIMMGGMVGASVAFAKYRNKFGNLFPDYSK
jgi:hypothetical protein